MLALTITIVLAPGPGIWCSDMLVGYGAPEDLAVKSQQKLAGGAAKKPGNLSFEHRVIDAEVGVGYGVAIADVDGNGHVDQKDFRLFQRCYRGSGLVVDLTCRN